MAVITINEHENFQLMCDEASKFYSSPAFTLIERIITEQQNLQGLSDETRRKYWLAMDMVLGNIRYGKSGWERVT